MEATSTTPRNEPQPSFLVVGPQKTGTTWLHAYFASRGDVCLPTNVKETFFFDRFYGRGLPWYRRHFHPRAEHRATCEVAPTYFQCPEAASRIYADLGAIPVVCSLRDPAKRTYSLYLHYRRRGKTQLGFRQAAARFPELLDSSRYASHLTRWWDVFGRERVLVVFQEALSESPDSFADRVCRHVQLPTTRLDPSLADRVNEAGMPRSFWLARCGKYVSDTLRYFGCHGAVEAAKRCGLQPLFFGRPDRSKLPKLEADQRKWIVEELQSEIENLEAMLNVDLSHWKTGDGLRQPATDQPATGQAAASFLAKSA